ncbi:MAG: hypothetical protein ACYSXF_02785 [Planctomycetota bacterium]|jgi:hypothetical protein
MHSRLVPASHHSTLAASAALLVALGGCAQTRGPQLVQNSHIAYNQAVSDVLKEELLLNVVRRRYMEAPQFLTVSSISSNISNSSSVGATGGFGDIGGGDVLDAGVDGSVTFEDSPTITITPRQGESMASQLHSPLRVSVVADLVGAGYPVSGTLDILVEGINNLRGSDLRYDRFVPASPEWREAMDLIGRLYDDGQLLVDRFLWNDPYNSHAYPAARITPEMWITTLSTGDRRWKSYDGGETFFYTTQEMAPALWLDPAARQSADGQRLLELLTVQAGPLKRIWIFESARVTSGPDLESSADGRRPTLKLRMRSLYNVLNYFSYGVQVPAEDEREGRATDLSSFRAAVERGEAVDVARRVAIRFAERRPERAFQAVRYRGLWYYIDDDDLPAKAGFNALYDLWQLSIKEPSGPTTPVTTIQVN